VAIAKRSGESVLAQGSRPSPAFSRRWIPSAAAALAILLATSCTPIELPGASDEGATNSQPGISSTLSEEVRLPELDEPIRRGEQVPGLDLVNQDEQAIELADYLGKVLVVSFFSCQHPDGSPGPAMARRLHELQQTLRPDLWDRVHILTVSVEPAHDTADELRRCARSLGADLDRWTLTLSTAPEFTTVAARLGVMVWEEEAGETSHTLSTLVIDQHGALADRFTGLSQWTVADLIASIVHTAES
jgi:protein SCO1/2